MTVTFSESIQWREHVLHCHRFQARQANAIDVAQSQGYTTVALAGKCFDAHKKGFLNVLIFDAQSCPCDGQEYKLADEVKDLKFAADGVHLYLITELKVVLVQFSSQLGQM